MMREMNSASMQRSKHVLRPLKPLLPDLLSVVFSSLYNSDASHWHHKVLLSTAGATSAATLYVNNVAHHFFY